VRRHLQNSFARLAKNPIFVLGLHKSGTSAITGLLAKRVAKKATIDVQNISSSSVLFEDPRREDFLSKYVRANAVDFSRGIIKECALTPFTTELLDLYPKSPCVFIIRDPRSTIRSILSRLDILGTADHVETASIEPKAWRYVLDNSWLGIPARNHIESLSKRWLFSFDKYLENKDRFILVRYEDFIASKASFIDKLAKELNLECVADISDSLDFQFQPKARGPEDYLEYFGSRNLETIQDICRAQLIALNYDMD